MATNFAAIQAIVNADATTADISYIGRRGLIYDMQPPPSISKDALGNPVPQTITAAQRATVVSTILAGTVTTLSDVTTLMATAVVGTAVTLAHIWRIIAGYGDQTVG